MVRCSTKKITQNCWQQMCIQNQENQLVAKGFHQTIGVDFSETFNPVIKPSTVRVVLSLVVSYNWDVRQIDVNNAFLSGVLHEDIYMLQPEGFIDQSNLDYICKVQKSLYGFRQVPRVWYDHLHLILCNWGFTNSKADSLLFFLHRPNGVVWLLVYVDDILVTGSSKTLINEFIFLA